MEWLEDLVRKRLPDVDLAATTPSQQATLPSRESAKRRRTTVSKPQDHGSQPPSSATSLAELQPAAHDLGLISFNLCVPRLHYLGASSGSLFARLLRSDKADSAPASLSTASESSHGVVLSAEGGLRDESAHTLALIDELRAVCISPGSHSLWNVLNVLSVQTLPKRDECDRLVRLFLFHYHPIYPIMHWPSLYALVAALYAGIEIVESAPGSSGPSLQPSGWPAHVAPFSYNGELAHLDGKEISPISLPTAAAILLSVLCASSYLQAHNVRFGPDPRRYDDKAFALTSAALADISVPSVQLVVLSVIQGFLSQRSGNSWVLLTLGMAYAVDMGLHRDTAEFGRFSPVVSQMRRRSFFCLYRLDRYVRHTSASLDSQIIVLELGGERDAYIQTSQYIKMLTIMHRLISAIQGRPLGFQDDTLDLSMPVSLTNLGDEVARSDQAYMGYSIARFRWACLVSEIKYHFYRFSSSRLSESARSSIQLDVHARLDTWLADTEREVRSLARPHTSPLLTKARIDYHYAVALLYQPSLAYPKPDTVALRHCFKSATERIHLFWSLYEEKGLILSWPTAQGISLAGTTLAYCVWTSEEIRASLSVAKLSADLRLCSSLLTLGGEWWESARKGGRSFQCLANLTIDSLFSNATDAPDGMAARHHSSPPNDNGQGMPEIVPTTAGESINVENTLYYFLQNGFDLADMPGEWNAGVPEPSLEAGWDPLLQTDYQLSEVFGDLNSGIFEPPQ